MYENWTSSISDFYCSFGFSTYKPNNISQKLNLAKLYILMNWYEPITVKSTSHAGSYTISLVQLLIKQFDSC